MHLPPPPPLLPGPALLPPPPQRHREAEDEGCGQSPYVPRCFCRSCSFLISVKMPHSPPLLQRGIPFVRDSPPRTSPTSAGLFCRLLSSPSSQSKLAQQVSPLKYGIEDALRISPLAGEVSSLEPDEFLEASYESHASIPLSCCQHPLPQAQTQHAELSECA